MKIKAKIFLFVKEIDYISTIEFNNTYMQNVEMKQPMIQATELLEAIGLKNTTTKRQLKNGTLQFTDPKNKPVSYTLHANGYYRKYIRSGYYFASGGTEGYQLNRVQKEPYFIPQNEYHKAIKGFCLTRILIPGEYLLMAARIVRIALKSRKRK